MGILDHKISEIAGKIMEHIDLEEVTREVLGKLVVTDLDLYFVVKKFPDVEDYDFVGMTYNRGAAMLLREKQADKSSISVFRFDMGKLVTLVEKLGGAERVA